MTFYGCILPIPLRMDVGVILVLLVGGRGQVRSDCVEHPDGFLL